MRAVLGNGKIFKKLVMQKKRSTIANSDGLFVLQYIDNSARCLLLLKTF